MHCMHVCACSQKNWHHGNWYFENELPGAQPPLTFSAVCSSFLAFSRDHLCPDPTAIEFLYLYSGNKTDLHEDLLYLNKIGHFHIEVK